MVSLQDNYSQRIWRTVSRVPAGKVVGYGFIADLAGLPGRARLVGRVLRNAPADLQLPWHRILRSNGQIAFSIGSAEAKLQAGLLQEEGVVVLKNRVNMEQFGWKPELGELMEMEY